MTKTLTLNNQTFILHPSGALFWEEENMLVISDVHLGKVSHFRKFGSAVPQQAVKGNFQKMDAVIAFFTPQKIVFLGDLFHSSLNKERLIFATWLEKVSAEVILVEGNHDIISPLKYDALGVKLTPEIVLQNFLFTHHPEERAGFFNFSGHIHPGVRINGLGRQQLKLSCFFKSRDQLILPALQDF